MYKILWDTRTKKDLRRIDRSNQERIIQKCSEILSIDPYIGRSLTGRYQGMHRLRIGHYRVIYSIYEQTVTVRIVKIGHRKEVYN